MRIAMFSWETLHSIAVGGVAAHVTELAAALQRKGHQVHDYSPQLTDLTYLTYLTQLTFNASRAPCIS
jgi:hypothetical protein